MRVKQRLKPILKFSTTKRQIKAEERIEELEEFGGQKRERLVK